MSPSGDQVRLCRGTLGIRPRSSALPLARRAVLNATRILAGRPSPQLAYFSGVRSQPNSTALAAEPGVGATARAILDDTCPDEPGREVADGRPDQTPALRYQRPAACRTRP